MIPEIVGILSSVCWAAAAIAIRRTLETTTPLTAAFVSVLINAVFLWPLALVLTSFDKVEPYGVFVLVLAGLAAPTAGRLLRFVAVGKLGAAPAAPLISTFPLFSAIIAVAFLGEVINIQIGMGTGAVILGIAILSLREEKISTSKLGLITALGSAFAYGAAAALFRVGSLLVDSPILGAAIGVTVSLGIYWILAVATKKPIEHPRRWNRFNYLNGIFTGLGLVLTIIALFLERVIIIAPLLAIVPLFTILFAWIFLRKVERITVGILLASVLVVIGSILVIAA